MPSHIHIFLIRWCNSYLMQTIRKIQIEQDQYTSTSPHRDKMGNSQFIMIWRRWQGTKTYMQPWIVDGFYPQPHLSEHQQTLHHYHNLQFQFQFQFPNSNLLTSKKNWEAKAKGKKSKTTSTRTTTNPEWYSTWN